MPHEVVMNGTTRYARFDTRAEPGKQAFAALQRWSIRATESEVA